MTKKLLVVSVAAINEPHRRAYDATARLLGWDVHIAAPGSIQFVNGKPASEMAATPNGMQYSMHALPHHFYAQQRLHYYAGLERLIARLRPDYVFAEYDPGSLPVLQAAALPFKQRVIAFTVENIARDRFRDLKASVRERAPKAVARDALVGSLGAAGWRASDALACISEQGKQIFEDQGWRKPIDVMPLGTDMAAFSPSDESALRRELGLGDAFVVGYFGRLVPEKGVHLLIDALAQTDSKTLLLLDMYANFAPGSYADQVMRRADELGLRDRIRTIDVPHAAVPSYMRCCDVIALPSVTTERWKEQFGRVLPEAMACEVPVVGSASGNIPHMIGDAGVVVPESDSAALAAAIEALRGDAARRRELGKAGRERVRARFSLEAQARALGRIADQL